MSAKQLTSSDLAQIILDGLDKVSHRNIADAAMAASIDSDFPDNEYGTVEALDYMSGDLMCAVSDYAESLRNIGDCYRFSAMEEIGGEKLSFKIRGEIANSAEYFAVIKTGQAGILPAAVSYGLRDKVTADQIIQIEKYIKEGQDLVSTFISFLLKPIDSEIAFAIEQEEMLG
jgi:hypothetical protein